MPFYSNKNARLHWDDQPAFGTELLASGVGMTFPFMIGNLGRMWRLSLAKAMDGTSDEFVAHPAPP
jgi:hypothetical protein